MIIIGWSYTTSGIFGDLMALIVALDGISMVLVRFYKNVDLVPVALSDVNCSFIRITF